MEEAEIPWIVAGPHVRRDHTIAEPVMQYDTAATVAILGVRPSSCWYGRVVTSAFAGPLAASLSGSELLHLSAVHEPHSIEVEPES
jgi:hypothetical protein